MTRIGGGSIGASVCGGQGIEGEVEVEDVDAGLAEEAELALRRVLVDEVVEGGFGEVAGVGDARDLVVGCGRRDVGIEA